MSSILILGYGNPLRCDDGIAWRAAKELAPSLPSSLHVEIRCLHQLTPELADDASRAPAVIFLDASCIGRPGALRCTPISPHHDQSSSSHHVTPQTLIALCQRLYASTPRAFVVSLTGQSFDYGESLSPVAENALPHFVATVRQLVEDLISSDPSYTAAPRSNSFHQPL